jgi:hypothetical protein
MALEYRAVDASAAHLKRAGRSAGGRVRRWTAGVVWVVFAHRGEQLLEGRGATQAEARHRACLRAEALGSGEW